ncbi:hypothetical protein [Streptomyces sp. NPDC058664]
MTYEEPLADRLVPLPRRDADTLAGRPAVLLRGPGGGGPADLRAG